MKKVLSLAFLLIGSCLLSSGQTDLGHPNLQKQFDLNPYLSINLGNLAINIHAPIRSKSLGPLPINASMGLNIMPYVDATFAYNNSSLLPVNVGTQYAQ